MKRSIDTIVSFARLLGKNLGVVSTVTADGKPESAFVYFVIDDDLNVYFATRAASRKYRNLVANPHVSFVMANDRPPQTVQIEGVASVVSDSDAQRKLFPELISLITEAGYTPPVTQMMGSELEFIKIQTTWARFGDFEVAREGSAFVEVTSSDIFFDQERL